MRRRQKYHARKQTAEMALSSPLVVNYTIELKPGDVLACPKCARGFRDGRGKAAHIKACKGA